MAEQECLDGAQMRSGSVSMVKEEPADEQVESEWGLTVEIDSVPVSYAAEHSKDEAPAPLIDIIKVESTLIQTVDDGLTPNQCSARYSTAPSADLPTDVGSARGRKNDQLEYSCGVCNEIFSNKYIYSQHKCMHSKPTPKIDKCNICGKMIKGQIKRHMNTHSKLVKFKCDVCSKVFTRKCHLDQHMSLHSKLPTWKCDECGKVFYRKCDLNEHMKIHSEFVKWKCDVCDKVFSRKFYLKEHSSIHTEIAKWKCEVCDKVFSRKSHFNDHMNTHSKLVKWKCDVCDKVFSRKYYLSEHMSMHSDFVKWKCDVCNKVFSRKCHLNAHVSTESHRKYQTLSETKITTIAPD